MFAALPAQTHEARVQEFVDKKVAAKEEAALKKKNQTVKTLAQSHSTKIESAIAEIDKVSREPGIERMTTANKEGVTKVAK